MVPASARQSVYLRQCLRDRTLECGDAASGKRLARDVRNLRLHLRNSAFQGCDPRVFFFDFGVQSLDRSKCDSLAIDGAGR